jgi:hypothetical protein
MRAPRKKYKAKRRCSCQLTLLDNGICPEGCNTPKYARPGDRTRACGVRAGKATAGIRRDSLTLNERVRSSAALAAIDPLFAATAERARYGRKKAVIR